MDSRYSREEFLAILERFYCLGYVEALHYAVSLGGLMEPWVYSAVTDGTPRRVLKSGARGNILRNHQWFVAVQDRIDAGATQKAALLDTIIEFKSGGKDVEFDALKRVWQRHSKLVRRISTPELGNIWVHKDCIISHDQPAASSYL